MYSEEVLSVSRADDGGYVVHVRVKKKKDKESKGEICCGPRYDDKMLIAKDLDEFKAIADKVLSDMKPGGMEEDEFAKAFKEAVKEEG